MVERTVAEDKLLDYVNSMVTVLELEARTLWLGFTTNDYSPKLVELLTNYYVALIKGVDQELARVVEKVRVTNLIPGLG